MGQEVCCGFPCVCLHLSALPWCLFAQCFPCLVARQTPPTLTLLPGPAQDMVWTCSRRSCPCPGQGVGTGCAFESLPIQPILWFPVAEQGLTPQGAAGQIYSTLPWLFALPTMPLELQLLPGCGSSPPVRSLKAPSPSSPGQGYLSISWCDPNWVGQGEEPGAATARAGCRSNVGSDSSCCDTLWNSSSSGSWSPMIPASSLRFFVFRLNTWSRLEAKGPKAARWSLTSCCF